MIFAIAKMEMWESLVSLIIRTIPFKNGEGGVDERPFLYGRPLEHGIFVCGVTKKPFCCKEWSRNAIFCIGVSKMSFCCTGGHFLVLG